jgi:hypothetical protein
MTAVPTPLQIANYLSTKQRLRCNCDLDNWSPTVTTGHSHVCRIHKAAVSKPYDIPDLIRKVRADLDSTK